MLGCLRRASLNIGGSTHPTLSCVDQDRLWIMDITSRHMMLLLLSRFIPRVNLPHGVISSEAPAQWALPWTSWKKLNKSILCNQWEYIAPFPLRGHRKRMSWDWEWRAPDVGLWVADCPTFLGQSSSAGRKCEAPDVQNVLVLAAISKPYILKASLATPTILQKNLNFPQICPKMPQNGPKMAKNDPKWPKYDPKWPKMAQNGPRMTPNDSKWPKNDPKWP